MKKMKKMNVTQPDKQECLLSQFIGNRHFPGECGGGVYTAGKVTDAKLVAAEGTWLGETVVKRVSC